MEGKERHLRAQEEDRTRQTITSTKCKSGYSPGLIQITVQTESNDEINESPLSESQSLRVRSEKIS